MPYQVREGRAYGPGIYDMKSGIVCGLWAVQALTALKITPPGPVRFFLNADEEVSSIAFRDELLAEARRARAVLVLEPAAAYGALKTSRKGVGEFQVTVRGRSAHAGINPSAGVNAISELARQIPRIEKLARPKRGLTVNVDVIQGGTRANVIPELAVARVDVRVPTALDREKIEKQDAGSHAHSSRGQTGNNRRGQPSSLGTENGHRALSPGTRIGTPDGSGTEGSRNRRRLRRQLYRRAGNPHARRPGRNRRRSPRPPRARHPSRIAPARGTAGGVDGNRLTSQDRMRVPIQSIRRSARLLREGHSV